MQVYEAREYIYFNISMLLFSLSYMNIEVAFLNRKKSEPYEEIE